MTTVLHRLAQWAKESPQSIEQRVRINGQIKDYTAKDYMDRVYYLALFLESKGITSKDIGSILSYNCPQWVHMDLAMMLLGGKSAGLYPNSTSKDILYILNHTQARVLSVQNHEYFKKITADGAAVPGTIEWVIVFDQDASFVKNGISYDQAVAAGKALAAQA